MRPFLLLTLSIIIATVPAVAQKGVGKIVKPVSNIVVEVDNNSGKVFIHYTLSVDATEIEMKIQKLGTTDYVENPYLEGDVGVKYFFQGEKKITWNIGTNELVTDKYRFDFFVKTLDKNSYDECRKIIDVQCTECNKKLETARRKFAWKKASELMGVSILGAASLGIGIKQYNKIVKASDQVNQIFSQINNGSGFATTEQISQYNDAMVHYNQRAKAITSSNLLKGLATAAGGYVVFRVLKYQFKGISCEFSTNCQGLETINIIKKF